MYFLTIVLAMAVIGYLWISSTSENQSRQPRILGPAGGEKVREFEVAFQQLNRN